MPASLDDLATNGKLMIGAINGLTQAVQAAFPRLTGTFKLAAAATTTVSDPNVKSTSIIIAAAQNAAAATLMGSAKALYPSAIVAGVSFTMATASGGNAAGTEQFSYVLINPS